MKTSISKLWKSEDWLAVWIGFVVIGLACAAVIAVQGQGLVDDYDFGIGAYYYADIPGFGSLMKDNAYMTSIPLWVHIALFLAWGWIIWRLWIWIDNR